MKVLLLCACLLAVALADTPAPSNEQKAADESKELATKNRKKANGESRAQSGAEQVERVASRILQGRGRLLPDIDVAASASVQQRRPRADSSQGGGLL